MKSKKTLLFTFFLLILSVFCIEPQYASGNLAIFATSGVAADRDTGAIYCSKNLDQQVGLASVSKFFAMAFFLDHMSDRNLTMESPIRISHNVATIKNRYDDAAGLYLPEGQEVSISKLLQLALVYSDNGAALQLAEALSGDEQTFVKEINQYFQNIGMTNTQFINATGLDEGNDKDIRGNYSTSREVVQMAIDVLDKHPEIVDITQQPNVEFNGETYKSWNEMLPNRDYAYPGIKGLKTGSSEFAGFNFLSYCERQNQKIITFIADAKNANGDRDRSSRFTQTASMLDFAQGIELESLLTTDSAVKVDITNNGLGTDNFFPKRNLAVVKGNNVGIVFNGIDYNKSFFNNHTLTQSIPQGDTVATLKVKATSDQDNLSIYYKDGAFTVELVNKGKTVKENALLQILYSIPRFFIGLYNTI